MIEIIKEREYIERIEYTLYYEWKKTKGAGFLFDCDKEGTVILKTPEAQANYDKCVKGKLAVTFKGIQKHNTSYWEDTVAKCICGEEIQLSRRFTSTCDECDRDYNSSGQLLADRSQWGEETGESYSDIMGPGDGYDY